MSAVSTRRGLLAMAAAGAVTAPALACSDAQTTDAKLLRLCADFEATIRRHNGLWRWQQWG